MASTKKNKEINHQSLLNVKSITDNQKVVFDTWGKGSNQFLLIEAECLNFLFVVLRSYSTIYY